jgi:glutathione S-transferase
MITIYNFRRGSRGVRVFWVCEEMGLAYRTEAVSYPPSAQYKALNPIGSVPFLTDDHGAAINESVAMMLYIAGHYGPTPLLPARDDPAFGRVLQMTVFGEATLGAIMNPLIIARFAAPEGEKENWLTRALEGRLGDALAFTAGVLGSQPYLAGDTFTLADISVSCAFDIWMGALGKAIPEALNAWRERVRSRPAYQRAAKAAG